VDEGFSPILRIADLMRGFGHPWFVAGGWAIDLFVDRVTRGHADIEIGIYRRDQGAIRDYFAGWSLEKAVDGKWVCWEKGEELNLPVHQVKVNRAGEEPGEFEFFLNEGNETHWFSRRHEGLTRPLDEVKIMSVIGIPILAPEIQLLFKAKQTRPKDRADFEIALPLLEPARRKWLADALRRYHPEHEWVKAIDEAV
jgi:hypothetical protein